MPGRRWQDAGIAWANRFVRGTRRLALLTHGKPGGLWRKQASWTLTSSESPPTNDIRARSTCTMQAVRGETGRDWARTCSSDAVAELMTRSGRSQVNR